MVYEKLVRLHHRLPGNFFIVKTPYMKKVLVPLREQGQKIHFCGTTLFAGSLRPLCPVPTHRLPVNAGNASEDTKVALFPLPSAAHLLLRFSLRSQLPELSVDAHCSFTPASVVSRYVMLFIHEMCAFVKNFFAS